MRYLQISTQFMIGFFEYLYTFLDTYFVIFIPRFDMYIVKINDIFDSIYVNIIPGYDMVFVNFNIDFDAVF